MKDASLNPVMTALWLLHPVCALVALLTCIPILWPEQITAGQFSPSELRAGSIILGAIVASIIVLAVSCTYLLLKMRNLRALGNLTIWAATWGISAMIFSQMAIEADVPSPYEDVKAEPIQSTATLHQPTERLLGPASLVIAINPEEASADYIATADNLVKLEREHGELLASYLSKAPRWAHADSSDTFYTRPGHVVLVPPATGGIPGTIHATFRTVSEGEPIPAGFIPVSPGAPFPQSAADKEEIPDIALELSGKHYLLLAWRGTTHRETAHKAINAAITTIDSMFERLAANPTKENAQHMCEGRRKTRGNTPELRVNEPNNQYGVYQAEVYANPGRPGTFLLAIRAHNEQQTLLRLFSFPARYSSDPDELFRHDIPGTIEEWMSDVHLSAAADAFPKGAPIFAILCGESHQYFGVTFELQFSPSGAPDSESQILLRRNYKVQAYERPAE